MNINAGEVTLFSDGASDTYISTDFVGAPIRIWIGQDDNLPANVTDWHVLPVGEIIKVPAGFKVWVYSERAGWVHGGAVGAVDTGGGGAGAGDGGGGAGTGDGGGGGGGGGNNVNDFFGDGSEIAYFPLKTDPIEAISGIVGQVIGDITFTGQSAKFNKESGNVGLNISSGLGFDWSQAKTVSLFVKALPYSNGQNNTSWNGIIACDNGSGDSALVYWLDRTFRIYDGGSEIIEDGLAYDTWYHLAIIQDAPGILKYYVNGNFVFTKTNSNRNMNFTLLGSDASGTNPNESLNGELTTVRIFNRVLTDSEISQLAQEAH